MPIVRIADRDINYSVSYQKRKTIQLKIIALDRIVITAPPKTTQSDVEKILYSKVKWITKHMLHYQEIAENPLNDSVSHGSQLLFMGVPHELIFEHATNNAPSIKCEPKIIRLKLINCEETVIRSHLKTWYKEQAFQLLSSLTAQWSQKLGVKPKRIVIKDQKTRWGSCSSLGNINYNWRIIMAPTEVIDYLIVHELCHLKIPNHSNNFWQMVGIYVPNFKACRNWLKVNGNLISKAL